MGRAQGGDMAGKGTRDSGWVLVVLNKGESGEASVEHNV